MISAIVIFLDPGLSNGLLSVFHTVMLLGVILLMEKKLYISDRYLLPALPLSFAWCFIGALVPLYILGLLFKMLPNGQNLFRVIWYATFSGFAIGAWYFSFVPLMPGHLSERKRAEREVILDFSRQIRERESVRGIPRDHIHPPFSAQKYYPDLPLKIVFLEISGKKWDRSQSKIHVISYLAGGREVVDGEKPDYIVTKYEPSMELALPISEARLLSRAAGNRCVYELWSCGEE